MATPPSPRPPPPAKRKDERLLLRVATVRSRNRRACASAPHTTCQKGPPIPQARVAPALDLRLLGKRSLSLLRRASAQTTRTQLRCCVVASILRTLRAENPKALARTAARALPDPPRPARQTAKPYQ